MTHILPKVKYYCVIFRKNGAKKPQHMVAA